MDLELKGKVALVTGASRGLGRAIALELALEGADIVATARDATALAALAREIGGLGRSCLPHPADLRETGAPDALAAAARQRFGRLDILVNNAGATRRGSLLELDDATWSDGFALKFFAHVRLARAVWSDLKAAQGSLVSIAGVGGKVPDRDFALGASVNAAIMALTKSLAELGRQDAVQVNVINPGSVRTDRLTGRIEAAADRLQLPIDQAQEVLRRELAITRFGEPGDIAGLVAFIVSTRGRWMHGAIVDMDGGGTKGL